MRPNKEDVNTRRRVLAEGAFYPSRGRCYDAGLVSAPPRRRRTTAHLWEGMEDSKGRVGNLPTGWTRGYANLTLFRRVFLFCLLNSFPHSVQHPTQTLSSVSQFRWVISDTFHSAVLSISTLADSLSPPPKTCPPPPPLVSLPL